MIVYYTLNTSQLISNSNKKIDADTIGATINILIIKKFRSIR